MPGIDATAAAAVAAQIVSDLAALPPGTPPLASLTAIVTRIYAGIQTNAIVKPTTLGVPTLLSAAPGSPVTGVGSIS